MKKLLRLLVVALLALPIVVNADEYPVHKIGEYVNFYVSEDEKAANTEVGISGAALGNPDSESERYVRTLLYGRPFYDSSLLDENGYNNTLLNQTLSTMLNNAKNTSGYTFILDEVTDTSKGITMMTKAEAMALFGLDSCDSSCAIDVSKVELFQDIFGESLVAQLSTLGVNYIALNDVEGSNIWVVDLTFGGATEVTDTNSGSTMTVMTKVESATLKKTTIADAHDKLVYIPVVYMDKNMECHDTEYQYMCYVCSGEYSWLRKGTQADTCEEVPGAKTKDECIPQACYDCSGEYKWIIVGKQDDTCKLIDDIKVKSDCAKSPKTGVEDYVLEFLIIVSVSALILFVVRKNDLFKAV